MLNPVERCGDCEFLQNGRCRKNFHALETWGRVPGAACPLGRWENAMKATAGRVMKRVAGGAVEVIKAKAGIDNAPAELASDRTRICQACDALTESGNCGSIHDPPEAQTCGCPISLKVTIAAQKCPRGKW